jgi:predicted AlkP superfamily pyrophosphatase or phosphodiesterase
MSNVSGSIRRCCVQYLMPAVGNSSQWDVLVGHYLGVDHAGHSGDVSSPDMGAKLSQMDDQMEQACQQPPSISHLT